MKRSTTPAKFGTISLIAAALALASPLLIVTVGIFLFFVAVFFIVLIGVGSGLTGLGLGIRDHDRVGIVTSSIALAGFAVYGLIFWYLISAMKNF